MPMCVAVADDNSREVRAGALQHVELGVAGSPQCGVRGNARARLLLGGRSRLKHSLFQLA